VVEQGIWIEKTSHELRDLYKDLDKAGISNKRLESMGYPVRMDFGRAVKKLFEGKQCGNRRMGSSRLKW